MNGETGQRMPGFLFITSPKKRKIFPSKERISSADKGKQIQTQTLVLPRVAPSAGDGLFQLPQVWFESGSFGSQVPLFLSDPELKVIRDLGVAG